MNYNIELPEKSGHLPDMKIHFSYYETLNEYLETTGSDGDYLFRPLANITETSSQYEVSFLLPVGSMDVVTVIVKDGYVIVHRKGNLFDCHYAIKTIKKEYDNSCFFRAVLLPEDADPKHFSKRYHNGEFKVRFAKRKIFIDNQRTFQNRVLQVARRLHKKILNPVVYLF